MEAAKKVLWVANMVPSYNRDLFRGLAARLPGYGIEFHLVSGSQEKAGTGRTGLSTPVIEGERKVPLREWYIGTYCLRLLSGVPRLVREIRPDVVVAASQVGNLTTWNLIRLKNSLGFRLAAWQCGYEYHPGRFKSLLLSQYVPRFDFHLAYHRNAAQYAREHGAREDQVAVMHNTLNEAAIALLPRAQARRQVLARHPAIGARRIILYVGAVLAEKRLELVADALDRLAPHNYVFVIVGDGDHLQALRHRYVGRPDIVFAGRVVDGVGAYFDAADVFVLPGTGGLALNEAMAHSLPLVSGYADGSADDLVIPDVNGIRLRSGSVEEAAAGIASVLADEDARARMGAASRALLLERFSFDEFLGRICRAISRLTGGRA
jgi:glycosyltransferase involved in cell wall biosynthesis